jgi:hypothetical protein
MPGPPSSQSGFPNLSTSVDSPRKGNATMPLSRRRQNDDPLDDLFDFLDDHKLSSWEKLGLFVAACVGVPVFFFVFLTVFGFMIGR